MAAAPATPTSSKGSLTLPAGLKPGTSFLLLLLALLFILLSYWAFRQPPRADALSPASWQERLLYPLETNAFRRLPQIRNQLQDIFPVPGSADLWVVGAGGLILHSPDNGLSWQQKTWAEGPPLDTTANRGSLASGFDPSQLLVSPAQAGEAPNPAYQQDQIPAAPDLLSVDTPVPKSRTDANNAAQQSKQQYTPQPNSQQQIEQLPPQQPAEPVQRKLDSVPAPVQPEPAPIIPQPKQPTSPHFPQLKGVFFSDRNHGWIVGTAGTLLATEDGGNSWQAQQPGTTEDLTAIQFVNPDQGWIVGAQGSILMSTDAGLHWRSQASGSTADLLQLFFRDARHGWIGGDSSTLLSTQDGGQSWQRVAVDAFSKLALNRVQDLYFRGDRGWVLGGSGTLLETSDGGKTWQERSLGYSALNAIRFSDDRNGWIAAEDGSLWTTTDSGNTWTQRNDFQSKSQNSFQRLAFRDAQRGWLLDQEGAIYTTADGGGHWYPQSLGYAQSFTDVDFADAKNGWAVGGNGLILNTSNGGRSWHPQQSPDHGSYLGVHFTDAAQGWIVGTWGRILHSEDGGQHWLPQQSGIETDLYRVDFPDPRNGWAVGDDGTLLSSTDAGQSWQKRVTGTTKPLQDVVFVDSLHGWILGDQGQIGYTADGGRSWQDQSVSNQETLSGATFSNANQGWVAGAAGTLLTTDDAGNTWREQASGVTEDLIGISFNGNQQGWAVGTSGVILHSVDGGASWRTQDSGLSQDLHRVHFQSSQQGWIAGAYGTLLGTEDGGAHWAQPEYDRYPAPWYWLSTMVLLAVAYALVRQKTQVAEDTQSIVDVFASDRPWHPGDPDPLQFGRISQGLSGFLRNPATEPPLTMAITGEWGSGKSSLMNQLYFDLKAKGFNPVWFNAWHHQKGEQILASLYANIRQQAVPGWLKFYGILPVGLFFRLKLLFLRSGRRWLLSLFLLVLFTSSISYLLSHPGQWQDLNWGGLLKSLQGGSEDGSNLLLAMLGAFPPLAYLFKALLSFGIRPSSLVVGGHGETSQKAAMNPSARQRFARDFADVTSCLELGRMVIFIDDLDRCSKENVLEIMEVINFLSVSGNCYIVLGMAEEWVLTCIGLGFEELAKQAPMKPGHSAEEHLRDFAKKYLEKLINISIPVPAIDHAGVSAILLPEEVALPLSRWSGLRQSLAQVWQRYHIGFSFVAAGLLAVVLGIDWKNDWLQQPETPRATYTLVPNIEPALLQSMLALGGNPANLPATSAGHESSTAPPAWELVVEATPEQARKGILLQSFSGPEGNVQLRLRSKAPTTEATQALTSGQTPAPSRTSARQVSADQPKFSAGANDQSQLDMGGLVLLALAFGGLLIWHLFRTEERIARDSPRFKQALQIWLPWILAAVQTPRQVKRHVNRIRCIAMLNKPPRTEPLSLVRQWLNRLLRRKISAPVASAKQFEEEDLVALSAIELVDSQWLGATDLTRLTSDNLSVLLKSKLYGHADPSRRTYTSAQQTFIDAMCKAVAEHQRKFSSQLFSDPTILQRYQKYSVQPRTTAA